MASIECTTSKDCFYNGKRFRSGSKVSFLGQRKELPSYLVAIEKKKEQADTKQSES